MKCVGFRPYSYQRAVIDEVINARGTGKIVCCLSSRQKGKTLMLTNILLYYTLNFNTTKNFCVSPTLKQAKSIFKTLNKVLSKKGLLISSNGTDLEMEFVNGSSICFKSAEQREALRGYTCTGILCIDEACFISDDIFNIIRPWVDYHKAVTLMTSTPYVKSGTFYQYYNYGLEHTHNTVSINWSDEEYREDIEKVLPPERLEEYRQLLPKKAFTTEYLGEWLDDDGIVFTGYKDCIQDNTIAPTDRLYVGIDWSNQTQGDYTVVSVFNQDGKQVLLRYFNNVPSGKQDEYIYSILEDYIKQIVLIQPELNSIGQAYTGNLISRLQKEHKSVKVEGFVTTNQSKTDLVTDMQIALEHQRVRLLDDDKQTKEFGYFTATYNPNTKIVTYNAPNGLHDDCVMATMIAYHAYKNNMSKGHYAVRAY